MLTKRQITVLELLAEGATQPQIAHHLYVELSTVKAHVEGILERLHARNSAHAVSLGYIYGYLHARRPTVEVTGPDSWKVSA